MRCADLNRLRFTPLDNTKQSNGVNANATNSAHNVLCRIRGIRIVAGRFKFAQGIRINGL